MKIFITTIGPCSGRNLDSEKIKKYFRINDCLIIGNPENADYIIVNTCAYKKVRINESIKTIRELKKHKKKIIVCGCIPAMEEKLLKSVLDSQANSFTPFNMDKIDLFFPGFKIQFNQIDDANDFDKDKKLDKDSGFIRISNGCRGNCSFCGIKYSIGPLKSKKLDVIKKEFKKLVKEGYDRISIVSDDTGAYGLDIGSSYPKLLKKLIELSNDRIMLKIGQKNPRWIIRYEEELLKCLKSNCICSLNIPIQSGSDRILGLMNRYHTVCEIEDVIKNIKSRHPDINIYTQFIIGFPTETEKDFQDTMDLIDKGYFDEISLHKYHEAEHMLSARIKPKINQDTIDKRYNRAVELINKKKIELLG